MREKNTECVCSTYCVGHCSKCVIDGLISSYSGSGMGFERLGNPVLDTGGGGGAQALQRHF